MLTSCRSPKLSVMSESESMESSEDTVGIGTERGDMRIVFESHTLIQESFYATANCLNGYAD